MKHLFFRISSAIIAALIVCAAFASCSGKDLGTNENTETSVETSAANAIDGATTEAELPEEEPTEQTSSVRYSMNNGQWGQFARYEYNGRGQLVSVTTVSPFTLVPLYYERIKIDRAYTYDGEGKMCRVWLSYSYIFDLEYSVDGLSAEGSCKKDDGVYSAKLSFSDKGMLVREEYISPLDTTTYEYDGEGRMIKHTQSTGFVTTQTYSEDKVTIVLGRDDGSKLSEYIFSAEGEKMLEFVSGDNEIVYTYEDDLLTKSEHDGKVCTIKYDGEGRVISTEADGEYKATESFEYGADGNISKYTRERKSATGVRHEHEKVTFLYTYAADGTLSHTSYKIVGYDTNGNETYSRTEEY